MDAFQDLFCLRPLAQADNPLAELKESCPAVRHQRFECSGSFSDEAFAAFWLSRAYWSVNAADYVLFKIMSTRHQNILLKIWWSQENEPTLFGSEVARRVHFDILIRFLPLLLISPGPSFQGTAFHVGWCARVSVDLHSSPARWRLCCWGRPAPPLVCSVSGPAVWSCWCCFRSGSRYEPSSHLTWEEQTHLDIRHVSMDKKLRF